MFQDNLGLASLCFICGATLMGELMLTQLSFGIPIPYSTIGLLINLVILVVVSALLIFYCIKAIKAFAWVAFGKNSIKVLMKDRYFDLINIFGNLTFLALNEIKILQIFGPLLS